MNIKLKIITLLISLLVLYGCVSSESNIRSIKSFDYSYGSLPLKEQLNANYDYYERVVVLTFQYSPRTSQEVSTLEYHLIVDTVIKNYYPKWRMNVFLDGAAIIENYSFDESQNFYMDSFIKKMISSIQKGDYISSKEYSSYQGKLFIFLVDLGYEYKSNDKKGITQQELSAVYDMAHNIKAILFDIETEYKLSR